MSSPVPDDERQTSSLLDRMEHEEKQHIKAMIANGEMTDDDESLGADDVFVSEEDVDTGSSMFTDDAGSSMYTDYTTSDGGSSFDGSRENVEEVDSYNGEDEDGRETPVEFNLQADEEEAAERAAAFSPLQGSFTSGGDNFTGPFAQDPPLRGSLRQSRWRLSGAHSAPGSRSSIGSDTGSQRQQRRVTISVPNDDYSPTKATSPPLLRSHSQADRRMTRHMSKRRSSVRLLPEALGAAKGDGHQKSSFVGKITSKMSFGKKTKTAQPSGRLNTATSRLQLGSSDLDNVAAAAAVVAASEPTSSRRQYTVDDSALAYLNILNHTNSEDPHESFTLEPVNKFGFPPGGGTTSAEQRGPYDFVLVSVKKVHFDEDFPYYTVLRADTNTEQRCDAGWMEPIDSPAGLEAALAASKQTMQAVTDEPEDDEIGMCARVWFCLSDVLSWPVRYTKSAIVPFYRSTRYAAKKQVTHVLYGDSPYACRVRMTGVNLLVLCSIIFVFIEAFSLAFLPASLDFAASVVGCVVWVILVLELAFEWLVRPKGYLELIRSEKAYSPSTARHINAFHLVWEGIALALFIPELICLMSNSSCSDNLRFTGLSAALDAVHGESGTTAARGRFFLGITVLRMFGLVRHWKNMWLNNMFSNEGRKANLFMPDYLPDRAGALRQTLMSRTKKPKTEDLDASVKDFAKPSPTNEEDQDLKEAAKVGTALMVVNSHRALLLLTAIVAVFPIIIATYQTNPVASESIDLLYQNNIQVPGNSTEECAYLQTAIRAWLASTPILQTDYFYKENVPLLWAQVLPVRCSFQRDDGVITQCPTNDFSEYHDDTCDVWSRGPENATDATPEYFAELLDIRLGGITVFEETNDSSASEAFSATMIVNQNNSIRFVHFALFLLMGSILALCIFGLAVLRSDADRLVLDPLQRMLKIVVRYAETPLSQTPSQSLKKTGSNHRDGGVEDEELDQLGNYETEQLINAIAKITDLLRKCWGVAGAGIISSNLARTQDGKTVVFNPTVPGKRVYALFGFVTIDGFSSQLRALNKDVMILINDVAKVVHDEVYRWALGDSGQCNKNLGAAFLMVFRIGDTVEVHEKKAMATDVVFSSKHKKSAQKRRGKTIRGLGQRRRSLRALHGEPPDTLQLASLPGIRAFSDRALLGMLKSFAGVSRDKSLQNWKKDLRLGYGVGAFAVNILIGMDAGWAVEGAVGSPFKIDATYLSPHVNMASRMMSASKQYGVNILLSQAVEELLSGPARKKLRHLDTVYVKGSSVAQRVFAFDARSKGADFFLFERTPEQADLDAELYVPAIWDSDQDIRAMRQHVTEDFEKKYKEGKDQYLRGDWKSAIETLKAADDIMILTVLEEGYIDYNPDEIDGRFFDRSSDDEEVIRVRQDLGDGACRCLIAYMERRGGVPPKDWNGVRPLTSK